MNIEDEILAKALADSGRLVTIGNKPNRAPYKFVQYVSNSHDIILSLARPLESYKALAILVANRVGSKNSSGKYIIHDEIEVHRQYLPANVKQRWDVGIRVLRANKLVKKLGRSSYMISPEFLLPQDYTASRDLWDSLP